MPFFLQRLEGLLAGNKEVTFRPGARITVVVVSRDATVSKTGDSIYHALALAEEIVTNLENSESTNG